MKNNPYIIGGAILVALVLIFGGKSLYDNRMQNADQAGLSGDGAGMMGAASTTASTSVANSAGSNSAKPSASATIGGQKDANGCITGAGYSWDSETGSCVRSWEKLATFVLSKKWYVVVDNKVFSKNVYFMVDQNSKISGRVCNSFSGTVKFDSRTNTVTSGPITSTLMACLDSGISNLESKVFRILSGTANVKLDASTGHLTVTKGADVIELTTNENEGASAAVGGTNGGSATPNTAAACASNGGQWSSQFKECTGVGSAVCGNIGGQFNECASACRNDPSAQMCTMQCVQVCQFK